MDSLLIAEYDGESSAQRVVEHLIERDAPMDMLSILGRAHPAGDDVLGIFHSTADGRVSAWAKQGALWGALWGLLAGAAGMFLLPGVGPVFVAGPLVEALVGALGGAAAMTGAAKLTELGVAMHRMGVPQPTLDHLHAAIEEGHYVLLLRVASAEAGEWKAILGWSHPLVLLDVPYRGLAG